MDLSGIPESDHKYFISAANRWRRVITSVFPLEYIDDATRKSYQRETGCFLPVRINGLFICVRYAYIDGRGGQTGAARAMTWRRSSTTVSAGQIVIDRDDVFRLKQQGRFFDLILHEIGHVLGRFG
jgi:hypothetical protein